MICFNNSSPGCDILPAGPAYGVSMASILIANARPTISSVNKADPDCDKSYYEFAWVFNDADPGDTQADYQIQIDDDSLFLSPEVNENGGVSGSNQYHRVALSNPPGLNELPYDSVPYYWRVRVKDSSGNSSTEWSDWFVYSDNADPKETFTTIAEYYYPTLPVAITSPSPITIKQGDTVNFDFSASQCAGGCSTYYIDFGDSNSETVIEPANTTTHQYDTFGNLTITLSVTGSNLQICSGNYSLTSKPYPKWTETTP